MVRLEVAGRLTRDVEIKTVGNGGELALFSVAVTVPAAKSTTDSVFFDCKAWSPISRIVKGQKKGTQIHFVAVPRTENWEGKDGKKYSKQIWYPVSIFVPPSDAQPSRSVASTNQPDETSAPPAEASAEDDVPF